jgi:hypothetical protein
LHAWDGAQAFFELSSRHGSFSRRLVKPIGLHLKRQQVMRIESGIDALQFEKAPDHQS